MRQWFRRITPTEETLRAHPSLRWMGPLLRRPWLWHLNRRRVALGAGIGVFFGFLIPVAQIAGAAVFALLLRANLPVAAVSTLVSNPLTYAPIFLLAYQTGAAVLGVEVQEAKAEALVTAVQQPGQDERGWVKRAKAIGKPLFLGLAIFAAVGGMLAWALVHVLWTVGVWLKRRRRRRREVRPA
ncbi:MAG: DUF2062 domain-containing protein [Burkholderiaceae bacterium]|jgi:uncharacterized protein (DUF2062 family)|nr:DUF2062 domain-containing protein [Burkholderiaceae bacterium]